MCEGGCRATLLNLLNHVVEKLSCRHCLDVVDVIVLHGLVLEFPLTSRLEGQARFKGA